jgi:hypothetical protein
VGLNRGVFFYGRRDKAALMGNHLRWLVIGAWMSILPWGAIGCYQKNTEEDYLIRAGDAKIMVAEYERAFDLASEEAFSGDDGIDIQQINDLRMRVLNQLTEELVIAQRAKALGLSISENELEKAVALIKADYPDDTFESTLLENAISFAEWKKKLATRILIEKVIEKELVDKVQITADDVTAYYRRHFSKGAPEDADNIRLRIVTHLRRQKAEEDYRSWMEGLRQTYPAEINQERWNQLMLKANTPSAPQTESE